MKDIGRRLAHYSSGLAIGSVLLISGGMKLAIPDEFAMNIAAYQIVELPVASKVAVVLPWIELTVGICLLLRYLIVGCLICSITLLSGFVGIQVLALFRGLAIPCGCFGATDVAGGDVVSLATVGRTMALLLVSLAAALTYRTSRLLDGSRIDDLEHG